jgi:hypothetical protein
MPAFSEAILFCVGVAQESSLMTFSTRSHPLCLFLLHYHFTKRTYCYTMHTQS